MDTFGTVANGAGRNWIWLLLYGILLIIIGIIASMNPLATGLAVGLLLSFSLFVAGVGSLIAAFTDFGWRARTVDIVYGILALLGGAICLANPFGGAISLVWVIGVMFLVIGGFELMAGFRASSEKLWLILMGLLDLGIGFWATFLMPPGAALVALTVLVGFGFLFRGVLLTMLAFSVRRLTRA